MADAIHPNGADPHDELIAVLDFGSQYAQLICRRVREQGVYSELMHPDTTAGELRERGVKGVILSGGPSSVNEPGAPSCDPAILELGVPVLGICYGFQLGVRLLGGHVDTATAREYGRATLTLKDAGSDLMKGVGGDASVWMSHGEQVIDLGPEFRSLAATATCPYAAARHVGRPFWGVQFHPEVTHTPRGEQIVRNFLYAICGCRGLWTMADFVETATKQLREAVGDRRVICGLSGGVDSSVTAALLHRAVGDKLQCIFVDNGLLRNKERQFVETTFRDHFQIPLIVADAATRFLSELDGVAEPQEKRRRIGAAFIDVFKEQAAHVEDAGLLAQGTLYPDVIESGHGYAGTAANIKLHHNVGGLPEQLGFELIEPLRDLFKDEVRKVGAVLGLPDHLVWRHPFPGPGLAVRVIGAVTEERLRVLREADQIVLDELTAAGLYRKTAQVFAVLLPVSAVGVMGDGRSYEGVVAIRAVESTDFMTADWARLPWEVLATMSNRIINEVRGVNRVVYDVSSKPPATIEWE